MRSPSMPRCACVIPARRGNRLRGRRRPRGIPPRADVDIALASTTSRSARLAAIDACPHLTVAAILGPCVGGGLEIACAATCASPEQCTLRRADHELGFSMYRANWLALLRVAGEVRQGDPCSKARLLGADRGHMLRRLVTRVAPDTDLMAEARATAQRICRRRAAGGGLAQAVDCPPAQRGALARMRWRASFAFLDSADYAEGVAATSKRARRAQRR